MNLDYALIRLSLWLSNYHALGWFAAGRLVNDWFAPLLSLAQWLAQQSSVPVVGPLAVLLSVVLDLAGFVVGMVLMLVLLIGSALLAFLAALAALLLSHAMAFGWTHGLFGVR